MRVTDKMTQTQIMQNIQKNRSELAQLQNQAASGKKLTSPSDDPSGAAKVLTNRAEIKNLEQFEKNINYAKTFLDTTESSLSQLSEFLIRAKELAMQGSSDTVGEAQRGMIATEVSQIFNSVLEVANRRLGDRFIFGGFNTQAAPFGSDGQYNGDDGEIKLQNQRGNFIVLNMTGDRVFHGRTHIDEGYTPPPSEIPKSVEQLQEYKLSEVDRQYENQLNDESQAARGPASVQRVQSVGSEISSGVNLFSLLRGLDLSLRFNDKSGIQNSLEPLTQALNQINSIRAEVGGRSAQLTGSLEAIQKTVIDYKTINSNIEDADMYHTMTELSKADTALKNALETSSRMMNMSLMDFIK